MARTPHNIWLKALLDLTRWLGFAAYLTLIVWTIAGGLQDPVPRPAVAAFLVCAYVVFIGMCSWAR